MLLATAAAAAAAARFEAGVIKLEAAPKFGTAAAAALGIMLGVETAAAAVPAAADPAAAPRRGDCIQISL